MLKTESEAFGLHAELASYKQSSDRFRSLLETSYDAFVGMNAQGLITDWNQQAVATFGWSREEVLGKNLAEIIIPHRFRDAHARGLDRFLKSGEGPVLNHRMELAALYRDGKEIPVEMTIRAIRQEDSYVFGAFLRDISDRKKTELFQHVRFEVTKTLADTIDINESLVKTIEIVCKEFGWSWGAFWRMNSSKEHLFLSNSYRDQNTKLDHLESICKSMIFARGEGTVGKVWETRELLWIPDITIDPLFIRGAVTAEDSAKGLILVPISIGNEFLGVLEFMSPQPQTDDKKLFEVISDIGTRLGFAVQKQEAQDKLNHLNEELKATATERTFKLHQSEKQLRLITDTLPMAVLYIDSSHHFRFVNETYAKWMNKDKKDIVDKNIKDIVDAESYNIIIEQIKDVFAGKTISGERKAFYSTGLKLVHTLFIPDTDSAGNVIGFISVITDVTKQRKAENDLRQAKSAAESANQAKSAFLANMSHEIRTPLGAVLGFADLLTNSRTTPQDRVNYIEVIKRNGDLLSNIISDILDLSKVEVGKLEMDIKETLLKEILTDTTSLLTLRAKEKGIQLLVSFDGAIPSTIKTDALRLRQILLNIVGNAIKFTERGTVEVTLKMMTSLKGISRLAFVVRDTGPGIERAQVAKLFKPFSQADISTRRKFGGTGLGLILSKRLAQLLEGDVVLTESTLGKGSTFTVTINPGLLGHLSEWNPKNEIHLPPIMSTDLAHRLNGVKVLLVEDSPDNQVLATKILRHAGAEVDVAENGKVALEKVHLKKYDIVLMDLQMPVMDGQEATTTLRNEGFKTPIIALTAHALKEERQHCLENGFDEHITKPIDRRILIESIAQFSNPSN